MWKLLRSKKLALWLIVILTIEISLINLEILKAVSKPLFLFTVAVFWFNCFSCTVTQVKKALQIFDNINISFRGKEVFKLSFNQDEIRTVLQGIKGILEEASFRIKSTKAEGQVIFVGLKSRWGVWGMAIFHVAILITILGAVWGSLSKLEGNLYAVEGVNVKELHQNYANIKEGILFKEKHAGFEMKINRVDLEYQGKQAPKLDRIWISIIEDGQEVLSSNLKTKQMINYQGYKISPNLRGFTPILQVDYGGIPSYNLLSLNVHPEPNGGEFYKQKIFIKDLQQEIDFRFFPSPPDKDKQIKDYSIDNPRLQLTYKDGFGKKQTKTIGLNEPIYINGQAVSMIDAKSWVELTIYKTPGITIVYFGFALALLGLSIYYGLPYQKITVTVSREGELLVYTYTKLNSATFENRVDQVIGEISKLTSIEVTNQQRRDEEVW